GGTAMAIGERIGRIFKRSRVDEPPPSELDELRPLTEQFYVTLKAAAARVEGQVADQRVTERLRAFTSQSPAAHTWLEAYEMEQTLVYLYDGQTLCTELGRRLIEARGILRPTVATWYTEQSACAKTADAQRPLLARLVNDLQWRYTVNELKRRCTKIVTRRTGMVFLASLVLFVVALTVQAYLGAKSELCLVMLAGAAGLWGASFSVLGGLKSRLDVADLDDLKVMRYYGAILTRVLIGAGGALIMYFFLRSGMLQGSAFPKLTLKQPPDRSLALLVVWCFVAGFS